MVQGQNVGAYAHDKRHRLTLAGPSLRLRNWAKHHLGRWANSVRWQPRLFARPKAHDNRGTYQHRFAALNAVAIISLRSWFCCVSSVASQSIVADDTARRHLGLMRLLVL